MIALAYGLGAFDPPSHSLFGSRRSQSSRFITKLGADIILTCQPRFIIYFSFSRFVSWTTFESIDSVMGFQEASDLLLVLSA